MNKQEIIQKINDSKFCSRTIPLTYQSECFNQGMDTALKIISKLDEPQKVKVPAVAETWLKEHDHSNDLIVLYSNIEFATSSDGFIDLHWDYDKAFYDWLVKDTDTIYILADALRYGYKVEPPKWIVKKKNGDYVEGYANATTSFTIYIDRHLDSTTPHKFTELAKAEAVAYLVEGTVEKVQV